MQRSSVGIAKRAQWLSSAPASAACVVDMRLGSAGMPGGRELCQGSIITEQQNKHI